MAARVFSTFPYWGVPFGMDKFNTMKRQLDTLSDLFLEGAGRQGRSTAGVFPLINLTEDREHYFVRAELPGIPSDGLDIQVVGRNLTISGERTIPSEGKDARYHRREREAGAFSRVISLPGDIDAGKVSAALSNGLLTVTLPKSEASKPKQIAVN